MNGNIKISILKVKETNQSPESREGIIIPRVTILNHWEWTSVFKVLRFRISLHLVFLQDKEVLRINTFPNEAGGAGLISPRARMDCTSCI